MNGENIKSLAFSIGETMQRIKYFAETGRPEEAKRFLTSLSHLRDEALDGGMEVEFFERRTYVRAPLKELPGHTCRACISGTMGSWTVDERRRTAHVHITVELIIDGTMAGGPQVLPGDVLIEVMPVVIEEEVTDREPAGEEIGQDLSSDGNFEEMMKRMLNIPDDPGTMGRHEV